MSSADRCGMHPSCAWGGARRLPLIALVNTPALYDGVELVGDGIDRAGCLVAVARGCRLAGRCTP